MGRSVNNLQHLQSDLETSGESSSFIEFGPDFKMGVREYTHQLLAHKMLGPRLLITELKQSVVKYPMSYVWWVLEPTLLALVYLFLVLILGRGSSDIPVPFYVFIVISIFSWYWTSHNITSSLGLLNKYSSLITQIKFPNLILVGVSFAYSVFFFLISYIIVIVLLIANGQYPSIIWFFWPLVFFVQSLFTLAVSIWCILLGLYAPDMQKMVPFLIRLWMYSTPVIYDITCLTDKLPPHIMELYYKINLLAPIIISYRDILIFNSVPDLSQLTWVTIVSFFILVGGLLLFIRNEDRFTRYL